MKASLLIAAIVLLVTACHPVYAQRFVPPDGELIVQKESSDYEGYHDQTVVTQRHIYTRATNAQGIYQGTSQEFEAPEGRYITSAQRKGPIHVLLLDNGDVWKYGLRPGREEDGVVYTPFRFNFRVATGGSETFKKIVGDDMYALSSSAIYVSRDEMNSWQPDTIGLNGLRAHTIVVDSDQNVYAATSNGVYFQTPTGTTWSLRGATDNIASMYVDRHNVLYRCVGTTLSRSTDQGQTWTGIANPTSSDVGIVTQDPYGDLYVTAGIHLFRIGQIAINDVTPGLLTAASEPAVGSQIRFNAIDADSTITVATNYGAFESTDRGTTWHRADAGIPAERLLGFAHDASGPFVTSTTLGVYYTSTLGSTWIPSTGALKGDGITLYKAPNALYALRSTAPKLWRSTDAGQSWDSIATNGLDIGGICVDPSGELHAFSGLFGGSFKGYLYEYRNSTWTYDTAGFTPKNYSFGSTIVSDGQGKLFVSGIYPGGAKVMSRPLAGGAWSPDTAGLGAAVNYLRSFATGLDLYGGATDALFRHTASGWVSVPLPAAITGRLSRIGETSDGALFASFATNAGHGEGIYYTKDKGANWTFAGYDYITVYALPQDGTELYATTDHGIFDLTAQEATLSVHADPLTLDFGNVQIGDSVTKAVTIATLGTQTAQFTSYSTTDPNFATGVYPDHLVTADTVRLGVTFKPTSAGIHQSVADLSVVGRPLPIEIQISGTGVTSTVADDPARTHVAIYPNPLYSSSTLHLTSDEPPTSITIYDALGERVKQVGGSCRELQLSDLPAGSYIVEVRTVRGVSRAIVKYLK